MKIPPLNRLDFGYRMSGTLSRLKNLLVCTPALATVMPDLNIETSAHLSGRSRLFLSEAISDGANRRYMSQ